jgi:hypothetical protein
MTDSWTIYDRLLDELPESGTAAACLVGRTWTLVRSDGVGMAKSFRDPGQARTLKSPIAGTSRRELAAYLKSWNLFEASLGLAALNSFFNEPGRVESWLGRSSDEVASGPVFAKMAPELEGKKVAVVGHFPDLGHLAERCELTILERNPQEGDLPDFAAEYVLPGQDFVFVTGTALVNKTLSRLLELAAGARVVLVGPSVPLTPLWFDWGVDVLAGTVVTDPARAWEATQEGGNRSVFENGASMVHIRRGDVGSRAAGRGV